MNPDPNRRKQERFPSSQGSLSQMSKSSISYAIPPSRDSGLKGMQTSWRRTNPIIESRVPFRMTLKTGGHLAKRCLGILEAFLLSPTRIWIHLLYIYSYFLYGLATL